MKYIVMERGYEYNDEGYTEQEGGDPVRLCKSLISAEKLRRQLTLDELRSLDHLMTYGSSFEECAREIEEIFKLPEGTLDDRWDWSFPEDTTDEQLSLVMSTVGWDTLFFIKSIEEE